nr:sugar-binding domain-containing protein [Streptomyces melanosporofaciens]
MELESALSGRYGLKFAAVAEPSAEETALEAVARCAAQVLADRVVSDSVVRMSNGTTLSAVVHAMKPVRRRDSTVVQMIGTLGLDNQLIDSPDLCRRLADVLGGTYRVMPVPLVVRTPRLATAMRRENSISMTLALGSHANIALVGIGLCDESGSGHILDGWTTPETNRNLLAAGAVGHLLGHHFDLEGRHLNSELCQRTVGVPLERLRECRWSSAWPPASTRPRPSAVRSAAVTSMRWSSTGRPPPPCSPTRTAAGHVARLMSDPYNPPHGPFAPEPCRRSEQRWRGVGPCKTCALRLVRGCASSGPRYARADAQIIQWPGRGADHVLRRDPRAAWHGPHAIYVTATCLMQVRVVTSGLGTAGLPQHPDPPHVLPRPRQSAAPDRPGHRCPGTRCGRRDPSSPTGLRALRFCV